jgi:hypothetical protein
LSSTLQSPLPANISDIAEKAFVDIKDNYREIVQYGEDRLKEIGGSLYEVTAGPFVTKRFFTADEIMVMITTFIAIMMGSYMAVFIKYRRR